MKNNLLLSFLVKVKGIYISLLQFVSLQRTLYGQMEELGGRIQIINLPDSITSRYSNSWPVISLHNTLIVTVFNSLKIQERFKLKIH